MVRHMYEVDNGFEVRGQTGDTHEIRDLEGRTKSKRNERTGHQALHTPEIHGQETVAASTRTRARSVQVHPESSNHMQTSHLVCLGLPL